MERKQMQINQTPHMLGDTTRIERDCVTMIAAMWGTEDGILGKVRKSMCMRNWLSLGKITKAP